MEHLTPIALLGAGGIGKTSIALTALHDDRIKQRFGDDRRFIRCDRFLASLTHFLGQLSKVIGAGIENPEDLTPLRPFLSSKEILIVLDNAESILDPQGPDSQEIYAVVEELSQFKTICLCITSRITIIPQHCMSLVIPTLPMEAARRTFYHIYKNSKQPDLIDSILEQLEFHPLSITFLATVAHHNRWDDNQLVEEWDRWRTTVIHTQHNESLTAAIELSLASPMFQELGPNARELLGVVAFFPQGIDENNLDWLFPTIPNRTAIFDKFCILSLTYQSGGFITMPTQLRDYLHPKDPNSSPLLCKTKDHYFSRLSVDVTPGKPGFEEAQWIVLEDVNVAHLLDVFTSIDTDSVAVWAACTRFMKHLYWHKPQLIMLGPKIEALPDNHRSKPECLFELSRLFDSVRNRVERKRLLIYALKLQREWGDDFQVAQTLVFLADANRSLHLRKKGIQQAKEALGIYKRHNHKSGQALSLQRLAQLLYEDNQLNAAEAAASQAVDLFLDGGDKFDVCQCHQTLGDICHSKGEIEKAIDHFNKALRTASSFNWHNQQFWIHYSMARLCFDEGRVDDAHAHIGSAKSHTANDTYLLGHLMQLQVRFWYHQHRLEEAKSGVLDVINIFETLGATNDMEDSIKFLQQIEARMK
jgi:tetratricopeptide (TPR) repeat protein